MLVVLPVVAKKPAAHHSPEVIALLSPGVVGGHVWGVRQLMGCVGSKIKELESSQESGYYPEQHQVGDRNTKDIASHIEQEGHGKHLQDGDVREEEGEKPTDWILMDRVVGILLGATVAVVFHMLGEHPSVGEGRKQP